MKSVFRNTQAIGMMVIGLTLLISGESAYSQSNKSRNSSASSDNPFLAAANEGSSHLSSGYPQWGLGVATATGVVRSTTALSLWYAFNPDQAIEGYFSIASTSPFSIGVGGIYKHTISGGAYSGLHVGGGLGLGSAATGAGTNAFFLNFNGVLGIHFFLPGLKNILINADAGPMFQLLNGSGSFAIGGFSDFLGLSIHYVF